MGSASTLLQAQSDLVSLWAVVLAQCELGTLSGLDRRDVIEDLREIDKQRMVALL